MMERGGGRETVDIKVQRNRSASQTRMGTFHTQWMEFKNRIEINGIVTKFPESITYFI